MFKKLFQRYLKSYSDEILQQLNNFTFLIQHSIHAGSKSIIDDSHSSITENSDD